MCNIAGYNGPKRAAPILIEMLKREEIYDGGYSTGIATIHEGKIHYRKVIGNVDTLLRETDALDLPGTVGFAHSRPTGDLLCHAHPQISNNGKLALVTNGTGFISPEELTDSARELEDAGFTFTSRREPVTDRVVHPSLSDGSPVWALEVCVNLIEKYMRDGLDFDEAMLKTADKHPGERVVVALNSDDPSAISVVRNTRPMEALVADGETYIATTRFAFPEDIDGDVISLPVLRMAKVRAGGLEITPYRMKSISVPEISPRAYKLAYEKVVGMLSEKECVWDDIELAIRNYPDIWNEKKTVSQFAKIGYDVLWQLKCEGRLASRLDIEKNPRSGAERTLAYMSLKK